MVIGRDESTTDFAEMLAELDNALGDAREAAGQSASWTAQRTADIRLMAVLKNLNERLSKLERYQEGR